MALTVRPAVMWPGIALWLTIRTATAEFDEVYFYYTRVNWGCEWGRKVNGFDVANITGRGGVCAYVPLPTCIYTCPAPDKTCYALAWSSAEEPLPGTIMCSGDRSYCCEDYESCFPAADDLPGCVAPFDSPQYGVPVNEAISGLSI